TTDCGGRTENNEEVFGGKPLPYLRSVACTTEHQAFVRQELLTGRTLETLTAVDGRSLQREVAVLSVLGFPLPRRVTSGYLRAAADRGEVESWIQQVSRLSQRAKRPELERIESWQSTKSASREEVIRLTDFVRLVVQSTYSEGARAT